MVVSWRGCGVGADVSADDAKAREALEAKLAICEQDVQLWKDEVKRLYGDAERARLAAEAKRVEWQNEHDPARKAERKQELDAVKDSLASAEKALASAKEERASAEKERDNLQRQLGERRSLWRTVSDFLRAGIGVAAAPAGVAGAASVGEPR